ncbi:hypothetical protein RchiOBHm_Chr5g0083161 [Rosa chinensis]|uniref:Uncharacterized protein n=1 Tax=Rosa chinensis TaxID=74649 RepID=A0A2P6QNG4_ROSCH|nr:hypothetical protein RchiOBHm_Chr5g0083161 [Rosa chinensis]
MASYEEKRAAFKAAERLQESPQSENPSFVKSMFGSHVYSCFCLVSFNEVAFWFFFFTLINGWFQFAMPILIHVVAELVSLLDLLIYMFTNSCSDYKSLPSKFCEDHLPK